MNRITPNTYHWLNHSYTHAELQVWQLEYGFTSKIQRKNTCIEENSSYCQPHKWKYLNTTACIQLANKLKLNNYQKLGKQQRRKKKKRMLQSTSSFPLKASHPSSGSHNMFGKTLLDFCGGSNRVWLSGRRRAWEQSHKNIVVIMFNTREKK